MIHHLLILFVSDHSLRTPAVQATLHTPPAPSVPGGRERDGSGQDFSGQDRLSQLKFVASVAANAAGFAGLIAGCWLGLLVLQAFM